jgi:hypothetical protein
MQRGRELSRAVDSYLKAISTPKRRGRQLTAAQLTERIADAKAEAEDAIGVARLQTLQNLRDLEAKKAAIEKQNVSKDELKELEADFIDAAAEYGDSKGIDYQTWRQAGVPAAVLKKAGIK